jgi:hypothetical protein
LAIQFVPPFNRKAPLNRNRASIGRPLGPQLAGEPEANSAKCGVESEIADRLRAGHRNTAAMLKKVCAVAQQAQRRGPAGPVGDFDDIGAPPLTR